MFNDRFAGGIAWFLPFALVSLVVGVGSRWRAALRDGHDAVFCPAHDGGYTLIGLTHALPGLFDAMTWGTDIVMEETRERLRNLGWRWHELPSHWDLDRPEDYQRLVHEGWIANADPGGPS
jgi:glycosyltransferase A (GT-A) superfamily protein (DUF2064 family)